LKDYAEKLKKQRIDFQMRIGLNTGLVVLAKIANRSYRAQTTDLINWALRVMQMVW
jgi:class 3 adenylate cyclase